MVQNLLETFWATMADVLPIAVVIVGFQSLVIRRPIANMARVGLCFLYVLVGLTFFLQGLEMALFPIGKLMAQQLTAPEFIMGAEHTSATVTIPDWSHYHWVYAFALAIGFSTTIAEPSLLAVALKAHQVSGGVVGVWGLRIAVAIGVAFGITLGSFRIITGTPLHWYILAGYAIVIIQTLYAPPMIIPLAYDSGGVTTSTVTVPIVTALGLGLASNVPGRNPVFDGFGLIAFASLFPIITVMAYAQVSAWWTKYQ
jgi:hypothetical protein